MATVKLNKQEKKAVSAMAQRTKSDRESNPLTGADLGAGPGAGSTT
jgi:Mn-containing catalase